MKKAYFFIFFLLSHFLWGVAPYELLDRTKEGEKETAKILLPNGVQCLLISNPRASQAMGALSVAAGTWDDPSQHLGMAHLVEHALFLGTARYPTPGEFMRYIQESGGESHGVTFCDRTVYGFSIPPQDFDLALERFSHLFIDPLFISSSLEGEWHVIQEECAAIVEEEDSILWRILEGTGSHAFLNWHDFCAGTASLPSITAEAVHEWFREYYRPEAMHLVIAGPQSIDKLLALCSHLFSQIPSRGAAPFNPRVERAEPVLSPAQKGRLFWTDSLFSKPFLSLIWEIPKEWMHRKELLQQGLYHSTAILAKKLKKKEIATDVTLKWEKISQDHCLLHMQVMLTSKGVSCKEEVIEHCFQALHALRSLSIRKRGGSMHLSASPLRACQEIMQMAGNLLGVQELEENPSLQVDDFLQVLSPRECLYFLLAPSLSRQELPTHPPSESTPIPEELLSTWGRGQNISYLIGELEALEAERQAGILEVLEEGDASLYFLPSLSEERVLCFHLQPQQGRGALQRRAEEELIMRAIEKEYNQRVLQGLKIQIQKGGDGLSVRLHTSAASLEEDLSLFCALMSRYRMDKETFARVKLDCLEDYPGDPEPLECARQLLHSQFPPFPYTEMELYQEIRTLSYEDYLALREEAHPQLILEGILGGGGDEALALWQHIQSHKAHDEAGFIPHIASSPLNQPMLLHYRTQRNANALLLAIRIDDEDRGLHESLVPFLYGELFQELRGHQHVAYRVAHEVERIGGHRYHCFSVQSSSCHSLDLLKRMESFLEKLCTTLPERLSEEKWERLQKRAGSRGKISQVEAIGKVQEVLSWKNTNRVAILIEGDSKEGHRHLGRRPVAREEGRPEGPGILMP